MRFFSIHPYSLLILLYLLLMFIIFLLQSTRKLQRRKMRDDGSLNNSHTLQLRYGVGGYTSMGRLRVNVSGTDPLSLSGFSTFFYNNQHIFSFYEIE